MKKQLIIALLSLTSLMGLSNNIKISEKDTVEIVPEKVLKSVVDSSALTYKEVYNDIKSGLSGLSNALKVGSEHVYNTLIKQQLVDSIVYLILLVISILLLLISIRIYIKSTSKDWDNPNPLNLSCIFLFIAGLIMLFLGMFNINNIITGFINPEYGAIKDILTFINK